MWKKIESLLRARKGSETQPPARIESLGSVTCPSGRLLILDGGLAWMWSHDRPPLLPECSEVAGAANAAIDLEIVGPDAEKAGRAFNRSSHPMFLYDRSDSTIAAFETMVREREFDATIVRLPARVPHRERVERALQVGAGLGLVDFHGMWAPAAGEVPVSSSIAVMGERMPPGQYEDRWRRVWLEVRPGEVATSREVGHVLVDEARLLVVDADALGQWKDDEAPAGLADFVFWGRDAEAVAEEVGARPVGNPNEESFGWLDLTLNAAREFGSRVEAAHSKGRTFAFDFRPHTNHWRLMKQVRSSSTESGVIQLGGADCCLFMTTWGDGAFPVMADLDSAQRLLRLRVELGTDGIVERQQKMERGS